MNHKLRKFASKLVVLAAKLLGTTLRDHRTNQPIGKAILLPFRGKIHLLGYHCPQGQGQHVIPKFDTQQRATYWKQTIVFTKHPEPDYPREHPQRHPDPSKQGRR